MHTPNAQSLVVEFQINAISQRIPEMTVKVRNNWSTDCLTD
jgi:hypothetical protein